jgi:hypothetical protein
MTDANDITQINKAHRAVIAAGNAGLGHAITAGKLLAQMYKSRKSLWQGWLKANCPEISDRTDRLYRRLAKKEKEIKAAAENGNAVAEISVRGAARLIAKPRTPRPPKAPAQPSPSRDIHTVLQFTEPDELAAAINKDWEKDKIATLAALIQPTPVKAAA